MKVIIEQKDEHCIACMKPNSSYDILVKFNNNQGSGLPLCKDCMQTLALALIETIKEDTIEIKKDKPQPIIPKFQIGQYVWFIDRVCGKYDVFVDQIKSFTYFSNENEILYKLRDEIIDHREKYLFASEEDAKKWLKENYNEC